MDDQSKEALKRLQEVKPKTLAGQLRGLMPTIDEKIRDGVRMQEVVEILSASGIKVDLGTLKSYLHRYRKANAENRLKVGNPVDSIKSETLEAARVIESTADSESGAKHPTSLDKFLNVSPEDAASSVDQYEQAWRNRPTKDHK